MNLSDPEQRRLYNKLCHELGSEAWAVQAMERLEWAEKNLGEKIRDPIAWVKTSLRLADARGTQSGFEDDLFRACSEHFGGPGPAKYALVFFKKSHLVDADISVQKAMEFLDAMHKAGKFKTTFEPNRAYLNPLWADQNTQVASHWRDTATDGDRSTLCEFRNVSISLEEEQIVVEWYTGKGAHRRMCTSLLVRPADFHKRFTNALIYAGLCSDQKEYGEELGKCREFAIPPQPGPFDLAPRARKNFRLASDWVRRCWLRATHLGYNQVDELIYIENECLYIVEQLHGEDQHTSSQSLHSDGDEFEVFIAARATDWEWVRAAARSPESHTEAGSADEA